MRRDPNINKIESLLGIGLPKLSWEKVSNSNDHFWAEHGDYKFVIRVQSTKMWKWQLRKNFGVNEASRVSKGSCKNIGAAKRAVRQALRDHLEVDEILKP